MMLALACLACAVLGVRIFSYHDAELQRALAEIEVAIDAGILANEYSDILTETINVLGGIDTIYENVQVNQQAQDDHPSIIVFDSSQDAVEDYPIFTRARNNMLAVGGRYILADAVFLDVLLMNAVNEWGALLEAEIHALGGPLALSGQQGARMYAQYRVRQLANISIWLGHPEVARDVIEAQGYIRAYKELKLPEVRQEVVELAIASVRAPNSSPDFLIEYQSYLPAIMFFSRFNDGKPPTRFPMEQIYVTLLAGNIAFMLAHELHHLAHNQTATFLQPDAGSHEFREAQRAESEADAFALEVLTRATARGLALKSEKLAYDLTRGAFLANQLFADMLVARRWNGIRALSAYALGTFIEYRPDRQCRGYFDQEDILSIDKDYFPLLSVNEWSDLEQRVRSEESATHPHESRRAVQFLNLAADHFELVEQLSGGATPVRHAMMARGPELKAAIAEAYTAEAGGSIGAVGIEPTGLVDLVVQSGFAEQLVAFCPYSKCSLYERDKTWVEFGFNVEGRVVNFSFLVPFFAADQKFLTPNTYLSNSDAAVARMTSAFELFQDIVAHFQDVFLELPVDAEAGRFIVDLMRCGGSSFSISDGHRTFRGTTLDEQFSFRVSFRSSG